VRVALLTPDTHCMLPQNLPQTREGIADLGDETVFTRIQESVFDMDRFRDKTAVQYILRANVRNLFYSK